MALWDFLKRKNETEKALRRSAPQDKLENQQKKVEKVLDTKITKEIKIDKEVKPAKANKSHSFSYEIVKEPHISEKATNLAEKNKYVFKIYKNANKTEIKKSVKGIYGVDVLSVKIIKIPAKKRRIGRTEGFKKGHNKAIVTIKEGQKIELI